MIIDQEAGYLKHNSWYPVISKRSGPENGSGFEYNSVDTPDDMAILFNSQRGGF